MRSWPALSGSRLLAPFGVIAVLLLAVVALISLQLATDSLRAQANERVSTTASVSADSVAQRMQGLGGVLESFARHPAFVSSTGVSVEDPANPVRTKLREMQRANPNIRSAFLLDATGAVAAVEPWNSPNIGADYSFRDYYQGALTAEHSYLSQVFVSSNAGRKLVSMSRLIHDPATGARAGVLVASVDVNLVFQSYVDEFEKNHQMAITIYDQVGNIVAEPGGTADVINANDPDVTAASQGKSSTGEREVDGEAILVGYVPVGSTKWTVSAAITSQDAFSAVDRLRSGVLLVALLAATILLATFVWVLKLLRARDNAQARIRARDERTRQIVETAGQAYLEIDRDGLVTTWNRQAEMLFGWTREEVCNRPFRETVALSDRREPSSEMFENLFDDTPDTPNRLYFEGIARSKEGEIVAVDVSIWVTEFEGRKLASAFMRDISERKRLEQEQELIVRRQRRLVEELRQADKVKSDFISTISHELRTPLTSIVGYLEMLRDGFGGDLTDQQKSMLDVVDRNSRRLLGLIDDVLTLSRIESGSFRVNSSSVDVLSLVASVQQALYPSIVERELEFDVDVDVDTGSVAGDVNQLERVLMNLLSNAVKFTPDGGRVGVRAYRSDASVHIAVSDTGIGIPLEEQSRLFSRFFRASSAHDHAIQGTGLGLTIVKSIIERHGGTISIESTENTGTTVSVELPITSERSMVTGS